jgi:hypothetical protein
MAADSYALSNPLSGEELALLAISGGFGYGLADFAGRYMATTPVAAGAAANSTPTGATLPNDMATLAFPGWQEIAVEFGLAALPLAASAAVDSPWGRAALQGMGLGAGAKLFGRIFSAGMASLIGTTTLGQQLYLAEYEASQGSALTTGTTSTTAAGMSGFPRGRGVGRPAQMGRGGMQRPGVQAPRAMGARGVGTAIATTMVPPQSRGPVGVPKGIPSINRANTVQPIPGLVTNTGDVIATPAAGTPTPGGPSVGANCAPCTSTAGGMAETYDTAIAAIRDDSCLGKLPGGIYGTFPE